MPGARCRVWDEGRLINQDVPYADGAGSLQLVVPAATIRLLVEWAPNNVPIAPAYPYRLHYRLDMGAASDDRVGNRLHNMGFNLEADLDRNVRAWQCSYGPPGLTPTGRPGDVAPQVALYHDQALLPPLPPTAGSAPGVLLPPTPEVNLERWPAQGCARESRVTTPFEVAVEVGERTAWSEHDELVIVDSINRPQLRMRLDQGHREGSLRLFSFAGYLKNERYTVKVRYDRFAYLLYEALDVYDLMSPATDSVAPLRPLVTYIRDDT